MDKGTILVLVLTAALATLYWMFGAVQEKRDADGRLMMRVGCFGKWERTERKVIPRSGTGE